MVLSGAEPGVLVMSTSLKKAERANGELRAVDQGAVVGVALGHIELSADDVVERRGVADDVDAVDVDARTFLDVERQVHGVFGRIGRIARPNIDEGETGGAGGEGQGVGRLLDLLVGIELAGFDGEQRFQDLRVQLLDVDLDLDLAEVIARALVHHIGHGEAVAAGVQFGDRRDDPEVVEPPVTIEFPQLLAVVFDAVGVIVVVGGEEFVEGAFLGHHDVAQIVAGELAVAEEVDAQDAALGPSWISKIRSTRRCGSSTIFGVTVAEMRPERR